MTDASNGGRAPFKCQRGHTKRERGCQDCTREVIVRASGTLTLDTKKERAVK